MLAMPLLDPLWATIITQCGGFIWLLACLTISMYGGNEPGKPLPDTYTFEQYQEYKRIHGAEATRKKVRELEARRAEKEKLDRRRAMKTHGGNSGVKRPVASSGKPLVKSSVDKHGESGKSGSKEVKPTKEPTTCREKSKVNPLAVLDNLGFSKKIHKKKKNKKKTETLKSHDPLADGFTKRRTSKKKNDEPVSDGDISDERKLNKHRKIHSSAERVDMPLTPLDMSYSKDSTASPSGKSITPSTTSSDTNNDPNRRLRAKWTNKAQNRDGAQSPLTAREKTRKEKGTGAFPMPAFSPPVSPKCGKDDDDFSPTVFEAVNAPVRPVVEKSGKKKKKKGSKRHRTIDETALTAIRINLAKPPKSQSPDCNDLAVDMEEPQQVSVEVKLQRIKEKLRRTHSQTVLQLEKKKKRKTGKNEVKVKQPTPLIALGGQVKPNQVRQPVALKKKSKKRVAKKADTSTTQSKTDTDKEAKGSCPESSPVEPTSDDNKTCVAVNDDKTVETVEMDNNTEVSFENECDTEEDTEESAEMFRLAKLDMRRTKSARGYRECAPEKLKVTTSARLFGRHTPNVRSAVAEAVAIEKAKLSKKSQTSSQTTSTSPCSTSPTCSTPPTASTSTTWSSMTVSGAKDRPPAKKASH